VLTKLFSVSALHGHRRLLSSASEMTYIVSSGALNSTHSLTHTHPSLNFTVRCCLTVEHIAAERHVGVVNICISAPLKLRPYAVINHIILINQFIIFIINGYVSLILERYVPKLIQTCSSKIFYDNAEK